MFRALRCFFITFGTDRLQQEAGVTFLLIVERKHFVEPDVRNQACDDEYDTTHRVRILVEQVAERRNQVRQDEKHCSENDEQDADVFLE